MPGPNPCQMRQTPAIVILRYEESASVLCPRQGQTHAKRSQLPCLRYFEHRKINEHHPNQGMAPPLTNIPQGDRDATIIRKGAEAAGEVASRTGDLGRHRQNLPAPTPTRNGLVDERADWRHRPACGRDW